MSQVRPGWWAWSVPLIACSVLVAGCNSGEDKAAQGASTTVSSSTPATVPDFSGDAASRYCELSRQVIGTGLDDSPEALRTFYEALDEHGDELAATAPEQVSGDVQTFVKGIRSLREPLESVDYKVTDLDPSTVPALRDPAFTSAGNRVVAYDTQVCRASAPAGTEGNG